MTEGSLTLTDLPLSALISPPERKRGKNRLEYQDKTDIYLFYIGRPYCFNALQATLTNITDHSLYVKFTYFKANGKRVLTGFN